MKGGVQSSGPQLQVIIPSAAYSGALISFVLCPSELVKVKWMEGLYVAQLFSIFTLLFLMVLLWHWALQCRMQVQGTDSLVPRSRRYSGPLDCALKAVKTEGVRKSSRFGNNINDAVLSWHNTFQVTGIFRGGFTTLLRESFGNAVFFSVYEYVRYYMHSRLKAASSDNSHLIDVGIGIVSGGLGGVGVCLLKT
jgi:solute carrier family 25 carnitine/acylcarnitine transporter 20/29